MAYVKIADVYREESALANRIVAEILLAGFVISVFDGEAYPVKRSAKHLEIVSALGSAEADTLAIHDPLTGRREGSVLLVWGNSADELVCDYSTTLEGLFSFAGKEG